MHFSILLQLVLLPGVVETQRVDGEAREAQQDVAHNHPEV